MTLEQKKKDAIWIAHTLFDRNKVSGSSANLSFKHDNKIYITASGSSFGRMSNDDFSVCDLNGTHLEGKKPSKELAIHIHMYHNNPGNTNAVIHSHSFYSTLWSMVEGVDKDNAIPKYTPYLEMKLGKIVLVEYAPPGSDELFELFEKESYKARGFLLKNHGVIVGQNSLLEAFYSLEELEESARIAWTVASSNVMVSKIRD